MKGNVNVSNVRKTPYISDTINGLPRKLYNEVTELLIEFWHKQPGWGDAAVEGLYAEKIIHAVRNYSTYLDTLVPTDYETEADYYKDDPVKGAGSMRYWTEFWLKARGIK